MSSNGGLVWSVISTMAGNVHFFLDNVTNQYKKYQTVYPYSASCISQCVSIFLCIPPSKPFFPLRKTKEIIEQVEEDFCQLRLSWFFRSLHALLKQKHSFDKIVFFHVAFLYHFYLVGRSMHLYHNDLKLHLHYFCTALNTSRVCFLFI